MENLVPFILVGRTFLLFPNEEIYEIAARASGMGLDGIGEVRDRANPKPSD